MKKPKPRFKIIADPSMYHCKLIDLETGEPIPYVQKITWSASVDEPLAHCTIELYNVAFEGEVAADIKKTGFVKFGFETSDDEFEKLCESINAPVELEPALVVKTKKEKKAKK